MTGMTEDEDEGPEEEAATGEPVEAPAPRENPALFGHEAPEAAREVFGDDRAVLAWRPGSAEVAPAPGGFRIHQAHAVADSIFHAAGAGAIYASNPLERRMRDILAVSQHLQARQQHFATVGQFLLGLEPDLAVT
ncbi:MAG TPA: hypothetical protein VEI03_09135 [Stellaceae bacterium]|nr:hypothetical protein [Stellaceae bacterium]